MTELAISQYHKSTAAAITTNITCDCEKMKANPITRNGINQMFAGYRHSNNSKQLTTVVHLHATVGQFQ